MKRLVFTLILLSILYVQKKAFAGQACCLLACAKTEQTKCNFPSGTKTVTVAKKSTFSEKELSNLENELQLMKSDAESLDYDITDDEMNEILASFNEVWQAELAEIKSTYEESLADLKKSCMNGSLKSTTEYNTTTIANTATATVSVNATDCRSVVREKAKVWNVTGGVFDIYPESSNTSLEVYCDLTQDDGGWTVFQRRMDGSVNFDRNWTDNVAGFGSADGEFWLGLENLRLLTNDGEYELRVDMADWDGNTSFAKYGVFSVADASDYYRLTVKEYSGDAGDSLAYHNRSRYSTRDSPQHHCSRNCAEERKGGWWYKCCSYSSLNGIYYEVGNYVSVEPDGVVWYGLKDTWRYSLKFAEMKFRKKN